MDGIIEEHDRSYMRLYHTYFAHNTLTCRTQIIEIFTGREQLRGYNNYIKI